MAQSQRTSSDRGGGTPTFNPLGRLRASLDDALAAFSSRPAADAASHDAVSADSGAATSGEAQPSEDERRQESADVAAVDLSEMKPEEALYAVLQREGGKMKQSEMVERMEWSKSKVSRRLGNLEDEGHIGRVQQGRQKVVFVKPGTDDAD